MIRPSASPWPYAAPVPPQAPYYRPMDVAPPPPPPMPYPPGGTPSYPGVGQDGKAFREIMAGGGLHLGIAAAVGGAIGFLVRGPVGAAWGAGIGTGLAQGFLQLLTRMADGSGQHGPLYAAIPTVVCGLGAWAAGAAWGAGAVAWTLILGPLAIAGAAYAWSKVTNQP